MTENVFSQIDFGVLKKYLEDDDVTDISYSNGGQLWLKTLSKGLYRVEEPGVNNAFIEKIAFQCSNAMGKSFNMAHPFLDAEGAELRLNFVHDSIARNGIACVMRKTPAKIRLEKDKIIKDKYIELDIHDFLFKCIEGHCNIVVSGETGSGKTEFVKYLASHTKENEKLITIEDTLELHLDRIFPHRDIVAMKTNNIASYSDVLVTCMRQNPKWILLSEIRSAEAVTAARNSISSGHYILSTIHADRADAIPSRMYSLLESSQDMEQFLKSIYRYIQIGVHVRGYQNKVTKSFTREIAEVCEFYVDENNEPHSNMIYKKTMEGNITRREPSKYLVDYLERQGVVLPKDLIIPGEIHDESANALKQVDNTVTEDSIKAHEIAKQEFMGTTSSVNISTNSMVGNNVQSEPIRPSQPIQPQRIFTQNSNVNIPKKPETINNNFNAYPNTNTYTNVNTNPNINSTSSSVNTNSTSSNLNSSLNQNQNQSVNISNTGNGINNFRPNPNNNSGINPSVNQTTNRVPVEPPKVSFRINTSNYN